MKKFLIQIFMAFNRFIIRISRGKMGSSMGGQRVLILHTIGRKSGQSRAVPIAYFRDGENFYIVGTNWAQEKHAAWYFNLKDQPQATLEVDGLKIAVLAYEATGEEYARLWQAATEQHPLYLDYKRKMTRPIPIMIFVPQKNTPDSNTK